MVCTDIDAHITFQNVRHQNCKDRGSLSDRNIPLFVDIKKPIFSVQNASVKFGRLRLMVVIGLGKGYHVIVQGFNEVVRLHIWFLLMRL
jgi:hypothetical protein